MVRIPDKIQFQPTPSSRRETRPPDGRQRQRRVSTHSLLAEGDGIKGGKSGARVSFQPTPSSRRETRSARNAVRAGRRFNPLPPRGGRLSGFIFRVNHKRVSTHSLLAEGDRKLHCRATFFIKVSTHSLLAEGDFAGCPACCHNAAVSTHSLLAEGDYNAGERSNGNMVSTHSLLAEGDCLRQRLLPGSYCFNPLPPRGGRHNWAESAARQWLFQPTPSSRRETPRVDHRPRAGGVSTHSLLAEGDPLGMADRAIRQQFQPTPSSRRETLSGRHNAYPRRVSTHSLLAEGDGVPSTERPRGAGCFNPLPPRGGRRADYRAESARAGLCFNPLPPRGGRRFALIAILRS